MSVTTSFQHSIEASVAFLKHFSYVYKAPPQSPHGRPAIYNGRGAWGKIEVACMGIFERSQFGKDQKHKHIYLVGNQIDKEWENKDRSFGKSSDGGKLEELLCHFSVLSSPLEA